MSRPVKRALWALAVALLIGVLAFVNLPEKQTAAPGTEIGEVMPDFSVECLDGSTFSLYEQRGKIVVINLWATWCTPCVRELPNFDRLQREYPADVAVLALHSPPVTADVPDYLSGFSYQIPFALDEDGGVSGALNASAVLPQTMIINPDGIVTYNRSGALSYQELLELVTEAKK